MIEGYYTLYFFLFLLIVFLAWMGPYWLMAAGTALILYAYLY